MKKFIEIMKPDEKCSILDIGGTPGNWELLDKKLNVTLLNLTIPSNIERYRGKYEFVKGDGTKLQFPDKSFDIVFSNSVIEHVGTFDSQVNFAQEIQRVGKNYFVQTPAKSFPFEPHLLTPFIHYFPLNIQVKYLSGFTLHSLLSGSKKDEIIKMMSSICLLNYKSFCNMFSSCQHYKEKFMLLDKSYVVYRIS